MGFFSRKRSTLKLVHPGGFAEIRKTPITAAEVMQKNPRHCVTRPDVFKFPWIVVRPESILKPGSVFFIVPCRTIHCLLRTMKSSQTSRTSLPQKDECLLYYDETLPTMDCLGSKDMEMADLHQLLMRRFPNTVERRAKVDCRFEEDGHEDAIFPKGLVDPDKHSDLHDQSCIVEHAGDRRRKVYPAECWPRTSSKDYRRAELVDPFFYEPRTLPDHAKGSTGLSSSKHIERLEIGYHQKLKSCLKKKNHFSKAHGFRVRFDLPGDDNKNPVEDFRFQDS